MHLLFWLSLVPVVTGWAGQTHFAELPVAAYSFVMLMFGMAYFILTKVIISVHGKDSVLFKAIGKDYKGIISLLVYIVSFILAFFTPLISVTLIILTAILWLIPDSRIEKKLLDKDKG